MILVRIRLLTFEYFQTSCKWEHPRSCCCCCCCRDREKIWVSLLQSSACLFLLQQWRIAQTRTKEVGTKSQIQQKHNQNKRRRKMHSKTIIKKNRICLFYIDDVHLLIWNCKTKSQNENNKEDGIETNPILYLENPTWKTIN